MYSTYYNYSQQSNRFDNGAYASYTFFRSNFSNPISTEYNSMKYTIKTLLVALFMLANVSIYANSTKINLQETYMNMMTPELRMIVAISSNDMELIQSLLEDGLDVNKILMVAPVPFWQILRPRNGTYCTLNCMFCWQ